MSGTYLYFKFFSSWLLSTSYLSIWHQTWLNYETYVKASLLLSRQTLYLIDRYIIEICATCSADKYVLIVKHDEASIVLLCWCAFFQCLPELSIRDINRFCYVFVIYLLLTMNWNWKTVQCTRVLSLRWILLKTLSQNWYYF